MTSRTFIPITVSKRCLGATGGDVANKLNQAAPLTVADIWQLHLCLDTGDAWDRVFSGAALFCIYARARWSDFIHGNCVRLDVLDSTGQVAYADMEVQIHKTMKAAANKFKFLDLVVSGSGIFGNDWVRSWVDALNNIGVDRSSLKRTWEDLDASASCRWHSPPLNEPWRAMRPVFG